MTKRMGVLAIMLIGLLTVSAVGQIEVIEVVEASRATPRGTLKLLRQAMETGDGDALRSILLAEGEVQPQMVEAMVQTAQSVRRLREAAVEAFGEREAVALAGPQPTGDPTQMKEIDEATETIEEDRAVVRFTDVQMNPVTLVRRGEQWHVPVAELAVKLSDRDLSERIEEVRTFNRVMGELTAEIAAGKHQSAEQARQALSSQMLRAVQE